jgi:hypothetical protein
MTIDQIAKLNQIEQWLGEIIASAEFKAIVDDYIPSVDVTLGDALMGVCQLLDYLQPSKCQRPQHLSSLQTSECNGYR